MKVAIGILLSALCLTYSAVASAENTLLVSNCAKQLDFVPISSDKDKAIIEGATVKSYISKTGDGDIDDLYSCLMDEVSETELTNTFIPVSFDSIYDEKSKVQYFFHNTNDGSSLSVPKMQSREELCADLKGKYHTHPSDSSIKVDRYAFCMGTQVHQGPTCKNSHGDPCGTQYDKSRYGYTIKED